MHNGENKIVTITDDKYEIKDNQFDQTMVHVKSMKRGQKLFTLGISKQFMNNNVTPFQSSRGDVKVKAAYRWDLISQDLIGKNQGMSLANSVTYGMSHEVSVGLAYTVGFEVGLEGIAKVNQSLTANFGYSFTTSQQVTETRTFNYNPIPDYRYPYYRGAIYQGKVKYTVVPDEKFKNYVNSDVFMMHVPDTEYKFKGEQDLPINMFAIVNSQ